MDIYKLVVISIILHLCIGFALYIPQAYGHEIGSQTDAQEQSSVMTIIGEQNASANQYYVNHGVCNMADPNERNNCTSSLQVRQEDGGIFDVFDRILDMATWTGKAFRFIGYVLAGPVMLAVKLPKYTSNAIAIFLLGLFLLWWDIAILINVIKFVLNKRGMDE